MFLTPSLLGWRLMDFMEFVATLAGTGSVSVLHSLVIILDHKSVGLTISHRCLGRMNLSWT